MKDFSTQVNKMTSKVPVKTKRRTSEISNGSRSVSGQSDFSGEISDSKQNTASMPRKSQRIKLEKHIMENDELSENQTELPTSSRVDMSKLAKLPDINDRNYIRLGKLRQMSQGSASTVDSKSKIPIVAGHDGKYISSLRKKVTKEFRKTNILRKYAEEKSEAKSEDSFASSDISEMKANHAAEHQDNGTQDTKNTKMKTKTNGNGEGISVKYTSSKIPVLKIQSVDECDDTHSATMTYRPTKSHFSPRQKITFQQQQQISTKRLLSTRQKSLSQIKLQNNYTPNKYKGSSSLPEDGNSKEMREERKKLRIRISTARSGTSAASSVNAPSNIGVYMDKYSMEELETFKKEQELLDTIKVDPCTQAEGPTRPVLPSGTSLTKAVENNSNGAGSQMTRYVYRVPNDGYSIKPVSRRHSTPVVNLSLDDANEQSIRNCHSIPRLPLGLIKIQLKQHSNVKSIDEHSSGDEESKEHPEIKSVKLSRIPIPREWQALQKYKKLDVFNDTNPDFADLKPTVLNGIDKNQVSKRSTVTKPQIKDDHGKDNHDDVIMADFPQRRVKASHKPSPRIKFLIKAPKKDTRRDSSTITVQVTKRDNKVSL